MTTIVANRDMIVSDSMVSVAHKSIWYPAVKIVKAHGMLAGASGDGADCSRFLAWVQAGMKPKDEPKWRDTTSDDQIMALIVKEDGVYAWAVGDSGPERIEADFFAVGSGGKAADAAMRLGKSPIEAVTMACDIDLWSALPIQVLYLNDQLTKGKP